MKKHQFVECNCDYSHCPICVGGLMSCKVCNCAEGTLPLECPGKPVGSSAQEEIMKGELEFFRGHWWRKKQ